MNEDGLTARPFLFLPPLLCPKEGPTQVATELDTCCIDAVLHHVERSVASCCVLLHPSISLPQHSLDIAMHSHIATSPQYENQ